MQLLTLSLVLLLPRILAQTLTSIVHLTTTVPPSTTLTVTLSGPTTTILPASVVVTTPGLSPQYTSQPLFHSSVLNSTNYWRYLYQAPFISFNSSLAAYAQSYSENCVWQHNPDLVNSKYGENLARGYPDVVASVDAWGNESVIFDFGNGQGGGGYTGWSEATGHFTQLVWQSTLSVGCGWTACNGKNGLDGVLLVCNYYPAGNIVGQTGQENVYFLQNVLQERKGGASGYNATAGAEGSGGGGQATSGGTASTTTGAGGAVTSTAIARALTPGWEVGIDGGRGTGVVLLVLAGAFLFGFGLV